MKQSDLAPLFILALSVILPLAHGQLCSTLCSPGMCSGTTANDCMTSCPADRILNGTTCSVDPSSGFALIGTSADLSGPIVASVSPPAT